MRALTLSWALDSRLTELVPARESGCTRAFFLPPPVRSLSKFCQSTSKQPRNRCGPGSRWNWCSFGVLPPKGITRDNSLKWSKHKRATVTRNPSNWVFKWHARIATAVHTVNLPTGTRDWNKFTVSVYSTIYELPWIVLSSMAMWHG